MGTRRNRYFPEWTQSRMDMIPNGTIPNGHDSKWAKSPINTIPNRHLHLQSYLALFCQELFYKD